MAGWKSKEIARAYNRMWREKNREHRKAYEQAYNAENREKIRERDRERVQAWHEANPEARKEHTQRYREKNREKIREANRKSIRDENGNITTKAKARQVMNNALHILSLETLAGRPRPDICDICGGPPDPKRGMHFDHCHETGRFRGWLCRECNLMLGNARDNPDRLRAGAAYLERFAKV